MLWLLNLDFALGDGEVAPVAEETAKGGWLSPEQVRWLRKQLNKRQTPRRNRAKEREERLAELTAIYDRIHGLVRQEPGEVVTAIRDAVEEYSAPSDAPIPPAAAIDWPSLVKSEAALERLAETLLDIERLREEEEETLLLVLTVV